ncbi:DNA-binding protein [Microvenator marinus]|uniref:DNA-binding protein n=1 Tax=Microvenator marinus TaxID=2600177 RepID=A0A5B8XMG4_9DELT|nr:DNA-binding protein [Microvenator marinus]
MTRDNPKRLLEVRLFTGAIPSGQPSTLVVDKSRSPPIPFIHAYTTHTPRTVEIMAKSEQTRRTANARGARKGLRRSKTIALKRLTEEERKATEALLDQLEHLRPKHRDDCRMADRPCPYVSCKYHLFLDVNPHTGSIKLNFPDLEVWELSETCALDVADRGGITLEEVGELLNLTRERIRQVEATGLEKLRVGYDDEPDSDM